MQHNLIQFFKNTCLETIIWLATLFILLIFGAQAIDTGFYLLILILFVVAMTVRTRSNYIQFLLNKLEKYLIAELNREKLDYSDQKRFMISFHSAEIATGIALKPSILFKIRNHWKHKDSLLIISRKEFEIILLN